MKYSTRATVLTFKPPPPISIDTAAKQNEKHTFAEHAYRKL
eukprot:XP_001707542.1 Hypothetical protein GL50803_2312 [Giardia lamblia ATCC 50803]